jgi:glutamine synthetase adenylyltransferase
MKHALRKIPNKQTQILNTDEPNTKKLAIKVTLPVFQERKLSFEFRISESTIQKQFTVGKT